MRRLLDVNLLIALAWPTHVHHTAARLWFDSIGRTGWATCPITRLGFVRVSSNPRFVDGAVSSEEAHRLLVEATKVGDHRFWPNDLDIVLEQDAFKNLIGHQQVTDAYLVATANACGGKLATFDKRVATLAGSAGIVEVIRAAAP